MRLRVLPLIILMAALTVFAGCAVAANSKKGTSSGGLSAVSSAVMYDSSFATAVTVTGNSLPSDRSDNVSSSSISSRQKTSMESKKPQG